jgi:hypothetical protein
MAEGAEALNTEEAAAFIRACSNSTFTLARDRALAATKIGARRFVSSADVDCVWARRAARERVVAS